VTAQWSVDFASRYIWRGFDLNPVHQPIVQPGAVFAFGTSGLSLECLGIISFAHLEVNEIDMTLSWEGKIGRGISFGAGLIHYGRWWTPGFRFGRDTSHEFFLSLGMPDTLFAPAVTLFCDFTAGNGIYLQAEAGYSITVSDRLEIGFPVSFGYNGGQWLERGEKTGFSDLNVGASLAWRTGRLTIAPYLWVTRVLLEAIGRRTHIWFGLSLVLEPDQAVASDDTAGR